MKIKYIFLFLLFSQVNCAIQPEDLTPEDFMLPDLPEIELVPAEIRCPIAGCNYSPKRKRDLARHIRYHTDDKPYACTIPGCSYRAVEKATLQRHYKTHDNKPANLETITDIRFDKIKNNYQCSVCWYKTNNRTHMKTHMRRHTGEKPFFCTYYTCDFRTAHKYSLKLHISNKHED